MNVMGEPNALLIGFKSWPRTQVWGAPRPQGWTYSTVLLNEFHFSKLTVACSSQTSLEKALCAGDGSEPRDSQPVKVQTVSNCGVLSHKLDIYSIPSPQGSGSMLKWGQADWKSLNLGKNGSQMSFGHDRTSALITSQQLWLSAHNQGSQQSSMTHQGPPQLRSYGYLMAHMGKREFSLRVWHLLNWPCFSEGPHIHAYMGSKNGTWWGKKRREDMSLGGNVA